MNKRRKLLIKKAFQLRYTGVILFFILLIAIISSMTIYLTVFPYLSEKLANVYPQGRLVSILRQANIKVLLATAIVIPLAAWAGLFLSHRIAGPWYRMEIILREMAEGNLTSDLKLRRGDELQSLAEALNMVTANLRAMSQEESSYIQNLDSTLKSFEEELSKEPLDQIKARLLLSKIQDTSKELKTCLKAHRLG